MPFNQDLTGSVEPSAKTWQDATPAERRWYYGKVAAIAERRKRIELMQAVGRSGVMDPRKRPRRDGADGPVMDPHGGASRTFRLLTSSHTERGCMLYWRTAWTTILGYHADGMVRGAPIRDVRLSDAGIAAVRSEGESTWRRRPKRTTATRPKSPAPAPQPVPSPVKGEVVRTALPKGRLKGPGLIDTRALKPRPPAPAPRPAATATEQDRLKAEVERQVGVTFVPSSRDADRRKATTVVVDVARLDAELRKDAGFHVGPGGVGPSAKPGAYEGFKSFLERARARGVAIEQVRVSLDMIGRASIGDGRHRFAVLRDMGVASLPVSVPRGQAEMFRRLFGAR